MRYKHVLQFCLYKLYVAFKDKFGFFKTIDEYDPRD